MCGGDVGAARGAAGFMTIVLRISPTAKDAVPAVGCDVPIDAFESGLVDSISLLISEFASQALAVDKTFFV